MAEHEERDGLATGAQETARGVVRRRAVLKGLATGLAGAVAIPGAGSLVNADAGSAPGSAQAAGAAGVDAAALARLLDDREHATLASLCELLLPGSAAAGVPDLVDRVAAVDSAEGQREFLKALRAFEHEARARHAARWIDLDAAAQIAILEDASTGPLGTPRPDGWTRGQPIAVESDEPDAPATPRDHLEYLRAVVARAYFATEPGMRELGWTGRQAWRGLPVCDHEGESHR